MKKFPSLISILLLFIIFYYINVDMGLQASQKIVSNSDPLRALRDISQNFPSLAGSLTRLKQNQTLKQEIANNQQRVGEGMSPLSSPRLVSFRCLFYS
jgi:hypothetical protein